MNEQNYERSAVFELERIPKDERFQQELDTHKDHLVCLFVFHPWIVNLNQRFDAGFESHRRLPRLDTTTHSQIAQPINKATILGLWQAEPQFGKDHPGYFGVVQDDGAAFGVMVIE